MTGGRDPLTPELRSFGGTGWSCSNEDDELEEVEEVLLSNGIDSTFSKSGHRNLYIFYRILQFA